MRLFKREPRSSPSSSSTLCTTNASTNHPSHPNPQQPSIENSSPTDFHRCIHISHNPQGSGVLKGVPSAWKSILGEDNSCVEYVGVDCPHLISHENGHETSDSLHQGFLISKPLDLKHNIHVDYNSEVSGIV